ncbi:phytanoyl-CoA dioxygenase family protein [Sphingomonas lenta]|nr:phytanoyl-CoA dioxygenase family protein [Sphingomonas lenta]
MSDVDPSSLRAELLERGFARVPGVLSPDEVGRLREVTDGLLSEHAARNAAYKAQGSMIPVTKHPALADLVAHPRALGVLARLGWPRPSFTDGYVISKPGGSPPLFWHYDWFAWEDGAGAGEVPPQLFAMYYLTDTRRENGCLRVIPGSHRRHNALHDLLVEPHGAALTAAADLSDPAFSERPDEEDVPVAAGDLLVGDARLLHAAHANGTAERRTLITLWYQPDFAALPERVQAQLAMQVRRPGEGWPRQARAKLEALFPSYAGGAEPYPRQLYRRPEEVAA